MPSRVSTRSRSATNPVSSWMCSSVSCETVRSKLSSRKARVPGGALSPHGRRAAGLPGRELRSDGLARHARAHPGRYGVRRRPRASADARRRSRALHAPCPGTHAGPGEPLSRPRVQCRVAPGPAPPTVRLCPSLRPTSGRQDARGGNRVERGAAVGSARPPAVVGPPGRPPSARQLDPAPPGRRRPGDAVDHRRRVLRRRRGQRHTHRRVSQGSGRLASMCGIAGYVGVAPRELLPSMLRVLKHRGPDDEGLHVEPEVGLGSTRLAIIDLDTGHQPIANADESAWVVFNGEIYNFRDLRATLQGRGRAFRTRSDTEVVLQAYEAFGDACVERLRGMFAFALWDRKRRRLLLGRDRLGKKPLYYWHRHGLFLFASELKALLCHPAVARTVDWDRAAPSAQRRRGTARGGASSRA